MSDQANEPEFTLEFNTDIDLGSNETFLYDTIYGRLHDLAAGHSDIIGAAATLRHPGTGTSPQAYEATVVAYVRPQNVAATKKTNSPNTAVQEALEAVERQIQEKREKLGKPWEQPSNNPDVVKRIDTELAEANSDEVIEEVYEDEN